MSEQVEVVIKIPKYYLTHPQDYSCLAECVRRGVVLPKGHGRLKDIDKIEKLLDLDKPNNVIADNIKKIIDTQPTIIEAD